MGLVAQTGNHTVNIRSTRSKMSELVVNIETGAKLSETTGMVEELSTSHDEWTMTEEEEKKEKQAMCNMQQREH